MNMGGRDLGGENEGGAPAVEWDEALAEAYGLFGMLSVH